MRLLHYLTLNRDAPKNPIVCLPRLTRRLLQALAEIPDPMPLYVVGVALGRLPRLLLICNRNGFPAVLTIGQDLRNDRDKDIIFVVLGAHSAGHD